MGDNDMMDLAVALTSTKYALVTEEGDNTLEIEMILQDAPVCVAEMYLEVEDVTEDLVKNISTNISTAIDAVEIDSDLKTVFIGSDPLDETTGLVVYQQVNPGKQALSFFERWEETHTLIFEFCVKRKDKTGKNLGPIASVRGIRVGEVWKDIQTSKEQRYNICENF